MDTMDVVNGEWGLLLTSLSRATPVPPAENSEEWPLLAALRASRFLAVRSCHRQPALKKAAWLARTAARESGVAGRGAESHQRTARVLEFRGRCDWSSPAVAVGWRRALTSGPNDAGNDAVGLRARPQARQQDQLRHRTRWSHPRGERNVRVHAIAIQRDLGQVSCCTRTSACTRL